MSKAHDNVKFNTMGNKYYRDIVLILFIISEALNHAFIHTGADLWPHPLSFASAEQLQQLAQQQALLGHPGLHQQLPVRSFL